MTEPTCAKCKEPMTPANSRIHPELFLHDACLPDELKGKRIPPKGGSSTAPPKSAPSSLVELFIDKTVKANQATTTAARIRYCDERRGVLDAIECLGGMEAAGNAVMAADRYYLEQHPHSYEGRMTGGLWHDWTARGSSDGPKSSEIKVAPRSGE